MYKKTTILGTETGGHTLRQHVRPKYDCPGGNTVVQHRVTDFPNAPSVGKIGATDPQGHPLGDRHLVGDGTVRIPSGDGRRVIDVIFENGRVKEVFYRSAIPPAIRQS